MNIWFRSTNQSNKARLTSSYGGSFDSALPIIDEHNRRHQNGDDDDDDKSLNGNLVLPNRHLNTEAVSGYSNLVKPNMNTSVSR